MHRPFIHAYFSFCVQSYPTDMSELELLSDLGNGTCGHVVKMRHVPTNQSFAVKVSS